LDDWINEFGEDIQEEDRHGGTGQDDHSGHETDGEFGEFAFQVFTMAFIDPAMWVVEVIFMAAGANF
jgi:hypothetical protein